jgi:ABC-type branched-subunit amino acid transport system substrate-binding protein
MFGLGGIVNSPEVWKLAGKSIDGTLAVDTISPTNKLAIEFKKAFAAKYGDDPYLSVHVENVTALMLLKKAFETAGSTDGPAVKAAFEKIEKFPSAMGQDGYTVTYTAQDHNGATPASLAILQFKDAKPQVLWDKFQPK